MRIFRMHYSRMERLHQHRTVRKQRFGIRKVSTLGAVSALLGTAVFFSGGVQADQVTATQPQTTNTETVVASPQETVSDTSDAVTSTSSEATGQVVDQTSEVAVVAVTSEAASTTATSESASSVVSTESVATSEAASATAVITQETSEVAKPADTSVTTQRSAAEGLAPAAATVAEEKASAGNEESSNPAVGVINYDKDKTTFDVAVVGNANTKAIKGARIAVWSADKGQDDLKWYTPVAINNQIRQTINILDHAGTSDDYYVHVYTDYTDGTTYGVSLGTYRFEVPADKALVGSASQGQYNVINKVVYLDAGHGGYDPGATYFGQYEKNLTLAVQKRVKAKLEAAGYTVVTSRNTDTSVELLERSASANKSKADIFVSLHFNAGAQSANGVETYYYQYYSEYPSRINQTYHNDAERLKRSSELAQAIQSNVVAQTGSKNNGVKRETFAVVRETTAPAVLVELGFISNQAEFNKINTAAYQEKLAEGVTKGILAYYDKYRSSTTTTTPTANPEVKVVNYDKNKTTFDVVVTGSNKTKTIKDARIAVWSADKGQDDLKWYTPTASNNQVHQTIDIKNHAGNSDNYYVHVYTDFTDGTTYAVSLGTYRFDIPEPAKPEVKVVNYDKNKTTFDVVVTGSDKTKTIKDARIAVWSADKGQDDLKWYTPTANNNQVRQTIDIKNHAGNSDNYYVHVYTDFTDGTTYAVSLGTYRFDIPEPAKPEVKVENYAKDKTTFDVVVAGSDKTKTIKDARIAVWSADKGQDDLKWYTPTASNNQVRQTIDIKNHAGNSDDYYVHVYTDFTDGTTYAVSLGTYRFEVPKAFTATYKGTGNYELRATAVPSSGDILFAVWSDAKGQDDLKWYSSSRQNSQAVTRINVTDHADTGTYHVHVYQVENGNSNFLVANTFTVDRVNYKTPYYRQRDPRWASKVYGLSNLDKTGCVPTSLAMVFSSLSGKEVLPTTVADYLYNNTDQFNKQWTGTGAVGILKAVDHWGYTATPLPSLSAVATALQEGYHVMAAVQNDIFVRNGSHELVLKGYNNGKTYVSDPYTPMLSGWYPISQLWSEQSWYSEDRVGLPSTFIKITDI